MLHIIDVNVVGSFSANHKYGIRLFRIPQDKDEFSNNGLNIEKNLSLCMNDVLQLAGAVTTVNGELNESGAAFDITNFEVVNNTTDIDVSAKITPNASMVSLMDSKAETDRNYKIILTIDDTSKSYKDANTVNVLIDNSNAKKNLLPLGTWSGVSTIEMRDINDDILPSSPTLPLESYNRMNVEFTLPKDATLTNPWKSLTGQIIAERSSTSERFELENFTYDITSLSGKISTKILPINYVQTRGNQMPSSSLFNNVTFSLFPSLDDASNFGVQLNYGFQVGYQNWIELPNANDYFEPKTNNWYTYSSDPNWQLKFEFLLEGDSGTYTNLYSFDVDDYGASSGVVAFTFKDENAVVITKPYATGITEVTATFTTASAALLGNEFASLSVRSKDGIALGEINTVNVPRSENNPLIPISGETKLKITVSGKQMTLVCNFDSEKVESIDYTFSLLTKATV